jgi:aldehyde dehydrogenase (NAD+)
MTSTASAAPDTVADPNAPGIEVGHPRWGGYKHSGFGRTMSAESVLDYTQIKTVVINA